MSGNEFVNSATRLESVCAARFSVRGFKLRTVAKRQANRIVLLYGDALGEVAGFVDVALAQDRSVVSE